MLLGTCFQVRGKKHSPFLDASLCPAPKADRHQSILLANGTLRGQCHPEDVSPGTLTNGYCLMFKDPISSGH